MAARLPGWHSEERGKVYVNDETGARITRRQYINLQKAQGIAPTPSPRIKEAVAKSREKAEQTAQQAREQGLALNIREAQRLNRTREATQEAKKATKQVDKQQTQPAKPAYQPHKVQTLRGKTKQGRPYVIFYVGKQVVDRAEAEAYEPYRPQLNDIMLLIQHLGDRERVVLVVGGILHYTSEDDENAIEYASLVGTAGTMRKVAGRVDSPEAFCKAFLPNTDPEICCYWARTAWGQAQRAANG